MMPGKILVVGAGFAGATYARELAEQGWLVDVIDQRPHIGGNAFDEVTDSGIRVHRYGPHLFHTNNARVADWLGRFGVFVPYEHKVNALLEDGRCVPLPVNRTTINAVFGTRLENADQVKSFLREQAIPNTAPHNAAEHLMAVIGKMLTDLFFRPYTRKMWALDLEDLDPAVVQRIPIRFDDEDRYFPNDRIQLLPHDGYTRVFERIFDHPGINVTLNQSFDHAMSASYQYCFNSMPIDVFFEEALGPLPYRSIRFHHRQEGLNYQRGSSSVLNYTDNGPLTRETDWSRMPSHQVRRGDTKIITQEEPCDYRDNAFERYYPVKTSDGRYDLIYQKYKDLASKNKRISFIGRCGTYQYLDMHQVINQSLQGVHQWIEQHR